MKRILTLLILISSTLHAGNAWPGIVQQSRPYLVEIEYYEAMDSPESLSKKREVKRQLSGILFGNEGLIITHSSIFPAQLNFLNASLYGSSELPRDITVRLADGKTIPATFVGKDDDYHVAFIRLDMKKPPRGVKFNTRYRPQIGDKLLLLHLLNSSYQNAPHLQELRINAVQQQLRPLYLADGETRALSFGLVMNGKGVPLGVAYTRTGSMGTSASGLIRMRMASALKELLKNPPVYTRKKRDNKKWLGITMQPFTRAMARYYSADSINGILINTIMEGSPAQQAGLQIGDVITSLGGIRVIAEKYEDMDDFRDRIRSFPRDSAEVRFWREGSLLKAMVHLTATPISQFLADSYEIKSLGFSVKALTKDILLAKNMDFDTHGVWISQVERAGSADLSGLRIGDILLKINNTPIETLDNLKKMMETIDREKPDYISLFIRRGAETQFIFIKNLTARR